MFQDTQFKNYWSGFSFLQFHFSNTGLSLLCFSLSLSLNSQRRWESSLLSPSSPLIHSSMDQVLFLTLPCPEAALSEISKIFLVDTPHIFQLLSNLGFQHPLMWLAAPSRERSLVASWGLTFLVFLQDLCQLIVTMICCCYCRSYPRPFSFLALYIVLGWFHFFSCGTPQRPHALLFSSVSLPCVQ